MLSYRTGDYVLVPAGDHAPVAARREPSRLYAIEANSHIAPPKRYLSRYGQLLEHAPYCERDLHGPTEPLLAEGTDVEVLVKHRSRPSGIVGTRMTYATHPFDVVGWDGCLYPYTFNVEDFMPITGKVHQPPPVHQVFEGQNFVICNFLPRKVDYHPQSIPVPYYHSNVDSDEVMFYVGGDYEARKGSGINIGSISLHPGGYAHGPQPSAIEASIGAEYFDELAVMVDTFRPLELGEAGLAAEDPAYAWTWAGRGRRRRRRRPGGLLQLLTGPARAGQDGRVPTYIALLRAVNVGGRVYKMADLRDHLTESGLDEVETYIQTGNVRFRSAMRSPARVEAHVERVLGGHVGFDVPSRGVHPRRPARGVRRRAGLEPPPFAARARCAATSPSSSPATPRRGRRPSGSRPGTSRGSRPPWSAARCTSGSARPTQDARFFGAFKKALAPGTNRDLKVVTTLAERWGA